MYGLYPDFAVDSAIMAIEAHTEDDSISLDRRLFARDILLTLTKVFQSHIEGDPNYSYYRGLLPGRAVATLAENFRRVKEAVIKSCLQDLSRESPAHRFFIKRGVIGLTEAEVPSMLSVLEESPIYQKMKAEYLKHASELGADISDLSSFRDDAFLILVRLAEQDSSRIQNALDHLAPVADERPSILAAAIKAIGQDCGLGPGFTTSAALAVLVKSLGSREQARGWLETKLREESIDKLGVSRELAEIRIRKAIASLSS